MNPTPEQAEILAKGWTYAGKPFNAATTMAHHPRLLKRFTVFTGTFLTHSTLPSRDRELLTLRTCYRTGTDYYFGHHVVLGEAAGLSCELALAVADLGYQWSAEDALLLRAADELTADSQLSDGTWAALADRYDEHQLIELLFVVGCYRMVSCYVNTVRVEREPGVPPIPARDTAADTASGDQPLRNARSQIQSEEIGHERDHAQRPAAGPEAADVHGSEDDHHEDDIAGHSVRRE
jgi:4-carboxymuconolactone decarboxylase